MKKAWIVATLLTIPLLLACVSLAVPLTPAPTAAPRKGTRLPTYSPDLPAQPGTGEAPFNIAWEDRSPFTAGLRSGGQTVLAGLPGASIYHIALSLSDPPTRLAGLEEVRYTNREEVPLGEVSFAIFVEILGGAFHLVAARADGQEITPRHENGFLHFDLSTPLQPGSSIVFRIDFSISIPSLGAQAYYGILGYNGGVLSLAHACPTILVYDPEGWHDQLPDLDGDPLFSDASFYLVSVEAPADLRLVASGTEVGRSELDGQQRVLFADGPARDFYLAGSRDFLSQTGTEAELTITSYYLPGGQEGARVALQAALESISVFNTLLGPYPYTEFDILPIETSAGGVEYPGLTAVNQDFYPGGDPFLEMVVVHEVGHQWFYNLVGNDTQNQPWLDESLAQYNTCQYYSKRYGAQAEQTCMGGLQFNWEMARDRELPIGLPVDRYSQVDYGAIIYGKGAFFFKALKEALGTATYEVLLQDYVRQFSWGTGSTAAFEALAEQNCNCDLSSLFRDWVNR